MVRALRRRRRRAARVLYVNVAGLTNVAVANDTGCLFTRAAAGGLDAMVATLAERRGAHARARARVDAATSASPRRSSEVEGDAELVAAARADARGGRAPARRHRAQLAELLPHAGERGDRRPRACSPAPRSSIPGFAERLAEQLQLPVEAAVVAADAR